MLVKLTKTENYRCRDFGVPPIRVFTHECAQVGELLNEFHPFYKKCSKKLALFTITQIFVSVYKMV